MVINDNQVALYLIPHQYVLWISLVFVFMCESIHMYVSGYGLYVYGMYTHVSEDMRLKESVTCPVP